MKANINRKVIYTSLTGGYDRLPLYANLDSSFDYICFTNDLKADTVINNWKIKPIPTYIEDKTRLSRYVKINPHKVLADYDFSIWIDSNIIITNRKPYNIFNSLIEKGSIFASIKHPLSNCIYEDAKMCIKAKKEGYKNIIKQVRFLQEEGYPKNNGLYENNIIFRKHNETKIKEISDLWWKIYMEFSKRDQLSLCYVFWKYQFKPDLLLPTGYSSRNFNGFQKLPHLNERSKIIDSIIWRIGQLRILFTKNF